MSQLTKIFYSLLPIFIFVGIDWLDDWSGGRTLMMNLKKDRVTAKVIENPFYGMRFVDEYGYVDYMKLTDHAIKSDKRHIVYSYTYENTTYFDSLEYWAHLDYEDEQIYNSFVSELMSKPTGVYFRLYAYKSSNVPIIIHDEQVDQRGNLKIMIGDGYVVLAIFFIAVSAFLFHYYFYKRTTRMREQICCIVL